MNAVRTYTLSVNTLIGRGLRLFGIFSLVIALMPIGVGAGFAFHTMLFLSRCVHATGVIQGFVDSPGSRNSGVNYKPVFTFTSQDHKTYTVTSDIASNPPGYTAGQSVPVLYPLNDPGAATLDSFLQLWFVPILCTGIGIPFALVGLFLLRLGRSIVLREAPAAPSWNYPPPL